MLAVIDRSSMAAIMRTKHRVEDWQTDQVKRRPVQCLSLARPCLQTSAQRWHGSVRTLSVPYIAKDVILATCCADFARHASEVPVQGPVARRRDKK